MIIGECPYDGCSGFHMVPIAPNPPQFSKETCEECHREYWLRHSRIDPAAYTLEQFEAEFFIDEEKKVIRSRVA